MEIKTLKLAQKRSRAGGWSWAQKVGLLLLQLLLNNSATDIVLVTLLRTAVETAIAWCTSCNAMARGHCLNMFVVLAAVHPRCPGSVCAVEPSLFCPPPTPTPTPHVPVPNNPPRFYGLRVQPCGASRSLLRHVTKIFRLHPKPPLTSPLPPHSYSPTPVLLPHPQPTGLWGK